MYFGEEYGLSVVSHKGRGTVVEIRIHAMLNAQENPDRGGNRENTEGSKIQQKA